MQAARGWCHLRCVGGSNVVRQLNTDSTLGPVDASGLPSEGEALRQIDLPHSSATLVVVLGHQTRLHTSV
jgi:hypothetical protein